MSKKNINLSKNKVLQMTKLAGSKLKNKGISSTIPMTFLLSGVVFVCFILIIVIVYVLLRVIFRINPLDEAEAMDLSTKVLFSLVFVATIIVGYGLTLLLSKAIMTPVKKVTEAMEDLSTGNYKKRLHFKIQFPLFKDISFSFNRMAEELEHTEVLSSDFINNFSHEFKTPISSICGFAKLLENGNLSEEQRLEYLKIIEEEANRLTGLATSVLKLMKVENQTILTDIKQFNISEQIRNCVLLLENKWTGKNLDIQVDFDEFYVFGNEELLEQVWINLLDNAIKYADENGLLKVEIKTKEDNIIISVANTGSEIPAEHQKHIFNKFYQADKSHASQGNGVGLAVVKKIVQLHAGEVGVVSGNNKTIFVVSLPYIE